MKAERILNPKTQREAVINHFAVYKELTSLDAFVEYGITRLASIICNLRKEGFDIVSIDMTRTNRFGNSVTFTKYIYAEPVQKMQQGSLFGAYGE